MIAQEIDIITVTYGNMFQVLKRTVDSLYRFTAGPFRLIIVNNGSTDETLTAFSGLANCTLINMPGNAGMVRAFNAGLKAASAPYVARMDHDVEFVMPWRESLLGALENDQAVGAAGPRVLTADGRIYAARFSFYFKIPGLPVRFAVKNAMFFPKALRRFMHFTQHSLEPDDDAVFGVTERVHHVTGAFMLMKRRALEAAGPADESYPDLNGAYEDLDYTLRLSALGFPLLYCGTVKLIHHCSRPENAPASVKPDSNRAMFRRKWGFL